MKQDRLAVLGSWAINQSHSRAAAVNGTAFKIIGTETGWGGHNEPAKAAAMMAAYTKIWNPDPSVAAIVPFLLAGQHWDGYRFSWAAFTGSKPRFNPIYTEIQALARSWVGRPVFVGLV